MKNTFYTCGAKWAFLSLISIFFSVNLMAHSYKLGDIELVHPWTWNTPPGAKVGGAFLTIKGGANNDKLIAAHSDVAGKTEIHTHTNENGVMKMRAISHIEIGAGKSVELKPGSFHIMFFDLKKQLESGSKIPLTLTFEKAGKIDVVVNVEDRAGTKAPEGHAGHKH